MKTKSSNQAGPGMTWLLQNIQIYSPYGRKALKKLLRENTPELSSLRNSLLELKKVVDFLRVEPGFFQNTLSVFKGLRDINGTFANLEQCNVLDETELFEIKTFALQMGKLQHIYDSSNLKLSDIVFPDLTKLVRALNPDQLIVDSFYLHEAYSDSLKEIRKRKREVEKIILASADLTEKEALRIKRSYIVAEEKQEEYNVRVSLTHELKEWLARLLLSAEIAGYFELLLGKASLTTLWPSCMPDISSVDSGDIMQIEEALNPEVAESLHNQGKKFTPVSIELKSGVTVLTGANMGGKTVALMTIAMNAELAKKGFFTFAKKFCMPLFDFVCFVGGDGQNQAVGLSSFGSEILRFSEVASMAEKGLGLAIFDEFARSTNPFEGSRFVQALCEFIQQGTSYGVVATHYDGVDLENASYYQVVGLKEHEDYEKNISTLDRGKILAKLCDNMDYRLKKLDGSYQVPRDALHIAQLLEADEKFLTILKKYYD